VKLLVQLVKALVEKNAFKKDTELTARYKTHTLGHLPTIQTGTFTVNSVKVLEDRVLFNVSDTVCGKEGKVSGEDILLIDGMDPARMAAVYGLKSDGTSKKLGKKRGRKTNVELGLA